MKETFYFSHDYNAHQDPKMMELLGNCGLIGVGFFWIIIEQLHQQETGSITYDQFKSYFKFYTSFETQGEQVLNKVEQVLFKTKLLVKQDDLIFSDRVQRHKEERKCISEERRRAGKISGEKRQEKAKNEQVLNNIKERKGKERKRKEIDTSLRSVSFEIGEASSPTPSEKAKEFFDKISRGDYQPSYITDLSVSGFPNEMIVEELKKFWSYWTEPTKSGKKARWETQPTFEIKRRLLTWFSRADKGFGGSAKPRTNVNI